MAHIELRDDGWFEAGKDAKVTLPMIHMIYQSKQTLKQELEKIGEQETIGDLEDILQEIPELFQFKGTPYLIGNKIVIDTPGLPGRSYLGEIKE
ncbi:MAG: hypothetical protein KKF46_04290 [Nanoarchaeota archaeon]|nr:hypothetical protein [Nanoarchaeota archaeon]MBU1321555.1 hypothetical protein [Nanoarchaeota archaeon]MBU1597089.1 hypothetical protein [Nanoarchaeota archaeon]MBU2441870.1 hypothetical protein [Nanoarchaeota archaeon]